MPIDALPSISRSDPDFRVKVDDYFLTRLPAFSTQAEAARVQIVAAESTATSAASSAAANANNASIAASSASTDADDALVAKNLAVAAKNAAEAAAAAAATFDPANYVSYSAPGKIAGGLIAEGDPNSSVAFTARNTGSGLNSAAELNAAYGSSAIGGIKAAGGYVEVGSGTNTPVHFVVGSSRRATLDTSGNLLVTGGALGYGVGSGGTVTQATSKSTGVALNKPCGQITMHNAALAAGATVSFDVSNTAAIGADGVVVTGSHTHDWSAYTVSCSVRAGGGFVVHVTNRSAASRSEALVINFQVVKGATS